MSFRLEPSPAIIEAEHPLHPHKRFRVGIYIRDLTDSTIPLGHFGEAYGESREMATLRAELMCIAVNKGVKNEPQEASSRAADGTDTDAAPDRRPDADG